MSDLPFNFDARSLLHKAANMVDDPDEATFLKRLAEGRPIFLLYLSDGGMPDITGIPKTVEWLSADYAVEDNELEALAEAAEAEWAEAEEYSRKWLERKARMYRK